MQMAALSIIKATYQHAGIVKSFTQYLRCDERQGSDTANEGVGDAENTARAKTILNEAGQFNR